MKKRTLITAIILLSCSSAKSQDWFQIETGTNKKLNTINFPSASIGYIGGNDSLLLKSTDYGETWNPINYTGITFFPGGSDILNLDFITDNIGYMTVGPYSGTYKTIDGGLTWVSIMNSSLCFNQGMYFFDENNGFVGGSGCFQGEMIDRLSAGVWSSSTVNSPTWDAMNLVVDIDFLNATDGLAASRSGYILRTIDGGISWDTVPTPSQPMNPITSVLYVNSTLAYAGYQSLSTGFGLYISIDGGQSWQADMESATFLYPDFNCLHQSGDGKIFTGGYSPTSQSGVIFQNPGQWSLWETYGVEQSIHAIDSYYDSIVFAVGDSGYLVVNQPLEVLSISDVTQLTDNFELYPNPTNSIVNIIDHQNLFSNEDEISIFSSIGELTQVMKFNSTLDISHLQPGVYIIQFETENGIYNEKLIIE